MILFGVETTDQTASVALMIDGTFVSERSVAGTRRHAETVAPLAEAVLRENGLTAADVDCFAVDVGPGSFTGVRIGVCFVNALGFAAQRGVIAVDSLLTLAVGAPALSDRVCALIDAGNGNAYAAQYEGGVCVMEPAAVSVEEFLPHILENACVVGSGALAYRAAILSHKPHSILAPAECAMPRAGAVLLAAQSMTKRADRMAAPLYLRPSQAERLFEKRMGERER